MAQSPLRPHVASPAELKERLAAESTGVPFVIFRDGRGKQRLVPLGDEVEHLTVGRGMGADIWLDWDERVSLLHAELRRVGEHWLVIDDGLSRNGTFVNRERVRARRRLRDGDQLELGATMMVFRAPASMDAKSTLTADARRTPPTLTPSQRRVLIALCRPYSRAGAATPATNRDIADELLLSVAAVKTHMRELFQRFGLEQLPQNQKRATLATLALETGAVSLEDLDASAQRRPAR